MDNQIIANAGGVQFVSQDQPAKQIEYWNTNAKAANQVTLYSSGTLTSQGTSITGKVLADGTSMYIYSGGTANYTTVNSGGYMEISSGGTATNIVENGG